MSSNPFTQWLALGHTSLAMFKQLGEESGASFKAAAGQLPESQAHLAQFIKEALRMHQEWSEHQAALGTSLLQTQLGALNARQALGAWQNLNELDISGDLSVQRKSTMKALADRAGACADDLRKAQNKDDVSMLVAGLLGDLGETLKKDAEQTFTLLNEANAAAAILTHKTLDELIGAGARPVQA